jgi:hypothetical protein
LIKNNIGSQVVLKSLTQADEESKTKLSNYIKANIDKLGDKKLIQTWRLNIDNPGTSMSRDSPVIQIQVPDYDFNCSQEYKRALTPKLCSSGFSHPYNANNFNLNSEPMNKFNLNYYPGDVYNNFSKASWENNQRMSRSQVNIYGQQMFGNNSFSHLNSSNPYMNQFSMNSNNNYINNNNSLFKKASAKSNERVWN